MFWLVSTFLAVVAVVVLALAILFLYGALIEANAHRRMARVAEHIEHQRAGDVHPFTGTNYKPRRNARGY